MQLSGPAAVAVTCCTSGDLRTLYMWVQTVDGPRLESYELGFLATDQSEVFLFGIAKNHSFKLGFASDRNLFEGFCASQNSRKGS